MTGTQEGCSRENCFAPDTGCVLGRNDCEFFSTATGDVGKSPLVDATGALPWSGLSLGMADLTAVAALGNARVVALVGLSDAGKTTALAATQLAYRRGAQRPAGEFAGSYTLMGWHQITRHLQWAPWGQGFPPHTVVGDRRTPALLHMALKPQDGSVSHVLYTDVPGEWYGTWAFDADAVAGVTWIEEHADSFVLFADTKALTGDKRGDARARYDALARRLATVAAGRPVLPVRSKADIEISSDMRDFIDDLNQELFASATMPISAHEDEGASLATALNDATEAAMAWTPTPTMRASIGDGDLLFAYRASRVPQ
jgi:hypothetical protein